MNTNRRLEQCTCAACGSAMHELSRETSRIAVAWCPVCHRVEARRRAERELPQAA